MVFEPAGIARSVVNPGGAPSFVCEEGLGGADSFVERSSCHIEMLVCYEKREVISVDLSSCVRGHGDDARTFRQ